MKKTIIDNISAWHLATKVGGGDVAFPQHSTNFYRVRLCFSRQTR